MKSKILFALLALGLCAGGLAKERKELPHIAFSIPGESKTPPPARDQFVMLVVEGAKISCEGSPIPTGQVVDYVNSVLAEKNVTALALHVREGTKYGDFVHAIDTLSGTNAKSIGVSMKELPLGREP